METILNSRIDLQICSSCRLCMEVCPCKVIGINKNNQLSFIPDRESICIQCGHCMAVCKSGACQVKGLSHQNFHEPRGNNIVYEDYLEIISTRRSVRNFLDKPVPEEIVNQMLESVCYAPNGAAADKMHITIINNRQKIEEALQPIEKFLDNIVKWMENPVMSLFIKRKNGKERYSTIRHHLYPIAKKGNYKLDTGDKISRGAPLLMIFHADKSAAAHTDNAFIYATYAMLAAHSIGLGCFMNGIIPAAINRLPEVREVFGIPGEHEATISLAVGYPKYKYRRTIRRTDHKINYIN